VAAELGDPGSLRRLARYPGAAWSANAGTAAAMR
jgi:hypothetical protein